MNSWISCSEWFRLVPDAGSEPIRWLLMLVPRFFPGASAYFKVVVWWIFAFYSCVPWVHGVFQVYWRWTCRWTLVGCFCWFSLLRSCVLKAGFFFNRSVHNFRSTFGIYWSFSMDFVPGTRNIHFKKTLVSVGWRTKPFTTGKWLVGNHPTSMNKKWLFRVPGSTYHISWSSLSSIVFHHLSHTKEPGAHCATQLI